MKRLEAQFGDIDTDFELLCLGDEEQATLGLEEEGKSEDAPQRQSSAPVATEATQSEAIADTEAAALMARLGAQFRDLDMSRLGLDVGVASGEGGVNTNSNSSNNNLGGCGRDSDEESSLEDPTPEELEAWQASQFSRGREIQRKKQASCEESGRTVDSLPQRRKLLRDTRSQQLTREQTRLRLQKKQPTRERLNEADKSKPNTTTTSILNLLGGDTSTFFDPSTARILEELVSEEADGDPEILQSSWKRLYASYEEGIGFWNLWKALKGYGGPTLLILRCLPSASKRLEIGVKTVPQTACLGFYTTTPWKDSSDMFGGDTEREDGDKAFLFSIDEKGHKQKCNNYVQFFPVEGKPGAKTSAAAEAKGYMYCQPTSKSSGSDGIAITSNSVAVTGIGIGGRPTQPRFHLTESFEDCSCLTYDSSRVTRDGDLFSCFDKQIDKERVNKNNDNTSLCNEGHAFAKTLYRFDVTELEAWGIGGTDWIDHALEERERDRKQDILRYQKVNKLMMWDQGAFGSNNNKRSS